MESKNIRFYGNHQVFLLKKSTLGTHNRRAELRTMGLYAYLKKDVFKKENEESVPDGKMSLNGWSLKFWDRYCSERQNSCLYFEKHIEDHVIAVDVFYDTTQDKEDAYCIKIFDRKGQKEQNREISKLSLTPFEKLLGSNFIWNDKDGYIERCELSRESVIGFLKDFIQFKLPAMV